MIRRAHLHRRDILPDGTTGSCPMCDQEDEDLARSALILGRMRSSGVVVALCPFHDEKTPSLVYRPRTGEFVCYGCRVHGRLTDGIHGSGSTVILEGQMALPGILQGCDRGAS